LQRTYAKLGFVFRGSGNKADALTALREGQAIVARVIRLSPENPRWKQDLAWFDEQVADLTK
jgi:hypothetical protein